VRRGGEHARDEPPLVDGRQPPGHPATVGVILLGFRTATDAADNSDGLELLQVPAGDMPVSSGRMDAPAFFWVSPCSAKSSSRQMPPPL
jgi:hypothetical protein